jgi:membrane-associated protease RseP (regulator of RpoE activity)
MSEQRQPFFDAEFPEPRRPSTPDVWDRRRLPEPEPVPRRRDWRINAALFLITTVSVFLVDASFPGIESIHDLVRAPFGELVRATLSGWRFAVPLLTILLFHEFGHYIAARLHRVDASLPYFIPLPFLSPFGTMGAVIAMRGRIRSRNALLDIGASGPLAGLLIALPVLAYGLSLSTVGPQLSGHYMQEGQSLLYLALKRVVLGPIPAGYDVQLHPTAFAGWVGLFVTMLNLLPWGQLDGGHVAYAIFGKKQDHFARFVRAALVPLFLYNATVMVLPALLAHSDSLGQPIVNSVFWLTWFIVTGIIARASGGAAHPPTEPGALSPARRAVAVVTLVFFFLLFMPTPMVIN